MHISIPAFTVAVILASLSTGASADTSGQPSNVTGRSAVYYGDLDLNAPQDAKIMLRRIEQAAKKACGGHRTFNSLTGRLDDTFDECWSEALARAVKQLSAPVVTRTYSEARHRES
jgi:UrcA family protein